MSNALWFALFICQLLDNVHAEMRHLPFPSPQRVALLWEDYPVYCTTQSRTQKFLTKLKRICSRVLFRKKVNLNKKTIPRSRSKIILHLIPNDYVFTDVSGKLLILIRSCVVNRMLINVVQGDRNLAGFSVIAFDWPVASVTVEP